jgi:ribonuclease P protein component
MKSTALKPRATAHSEIIRTMLPRAERISTRDFREAFENSRALRHPLMQVRLHWRAQSYAHEKARAAFVVSRKLGKATVRNRIRRRVREIYRLSSLRHSAVLSKADLLFFVSAQGVEAEHNDLQEAMEQLLRRAISSGATLSRDASSYKNQVEVRGSRE